MSRRQCEDVCPFLPREMLIITGARIRKDGETFLAIFWWISRTRLQPLLQGTYSEISCGSGDEPEYALPKMDRHFPPRSLPPPYHLQHLETSLLDASNSNVYQVAATLTHYPSPNHDGRYETTVKVISTHKYPHHLSQFRSLSDSAPFA